MAPVGALLQRALRVHQVYGANTDVGKTILTTILCNSAAKIWKNEQVSYLKPVSTGALDDADEGCMCSIYPSSWKLARANHAQMLRPNQLQVWTSN